MPVTQPPPPVDPRPILIPGFGLTELEQPWASQPALPWSGDPFATLGTGIIGGPCCCGCVTVCVTICGGLPVVGATIQVLSGGTVLASCLTGSTGCCEVCIVGTYQVKVTVSGSVVYSATRSLSAGAHLTVALGGNASVVCCGGYAIPTSLTLTDAAGSLAFDYYAGSFYPTWYGGHAVQRLSCSVTTTSNTCVSAAPGTGPVRVCYQMVCFAGTHPTFSFQRSWSWVFPQGVLTPIWYQDPSGFVAGQPCTTAPPTICGSPRTDTSNDFQDPTSTSPFAIAFNPVPALGNSTSDPVGGTVAIS